jgi:hypothetical protein
MAKRYYPLPSIFMKPLIRKVLMINNISSLMSLRYVKIQDKLHQKIIRDIALNNTMSKIYYVTNTGLIMQKVDLMHMPFITASSGPTVQNVSGIYQPSSNFYMEKSLDDFMAKIVYKFVHIVLGGVPVTNKTDLLLRLELFLQPDNLLGNNIYYYPVAQHIIVNVLANVKNINIKILEHITEGFIDYSAFENLIINPLTIVEAVVMRNTALDLFKSNKKGFKVIAQNAEEQLCNNFSVASYKQSKQPFMDFRVEQYVIETQNNKMFFLDSKLRGDPVNTVSLTKGYLSLATNINMPIIIKKFMGDMVVSATAKGASLSELKSIEHYKTILLQILKNKQLSLSDMNTSFKEVISNMYHDPSIACIIPSIIQSPRHNLNFNDYLTNNVHEIYSMVQFIKNDVITTNIKTFIPDKGEQKVHVDMWHTAILKIIKKIPVEKRAIFLENYHKLKLLEYDPSI